RRLVPRAGRVLRRTRSDGPGRSAARGLPRTADAADAVTPSGTGMPRRWAVVGATRSGMSDLALDFAERLRAQGYGADSVNDDAMVLYRGMDIGTAKVAVDVRRGIRHHLFDVREVTDEAAVAWFQLLARRVIGEIHARGADAVLVGGSVLYVSSVIFD